MTIYPSEVATGARSKDMALITIDFVAMNDDRGETELLARVRWPFLPRTGETVVLRSLRVKADEEKELDEQRTEDVMFVVEDIQYSADAHWTIGRTKEGVEAEPQEEYDVEIFLVLPPESRSWTGLQRTETT
jgi:hypothetical protein